MHGTLCNAIYWWSPKQPQVTDLRWPVDSCSGLPVTSERYRASFQVIRLFHKTTVSHCDHFLLLHVYLLFETSPGWLQGWRGFFLTTIWWGSTQLQYIYYLRRILISRPPRVFRRCKRRSCQSYQQSLCHGLKTLTVRPQLIPVRFTSRHRCFVKLKQWYLCKIEKKDYTGSRQKILKYCLRRDDKVKWNKVLVHQDKKDICKYICITRS